MPGSVSDFPFRNATLSLTARLDDLLGRLTYDEKLALCAGRNFWQTKPIRRLGIEPFKLSDGPHGLAPHSSWKRCTAFPASICTAATWDEALAEQRGAALGSEARSLGVGMLLCPGINICRTPLNGRTFEYLSEDPYLNRKLAVPLVRGLQSQRVSACVKHFVANNQETRRMSVSAQVSERALREIYLPAFEATIEEADVWSIMASYNRINGIYACENKSLLVDLLREEFGFQGCVVSDWFAACKASSTQACVEAGLSLEMPGKGSRYRLRSLRRAAHAGKLREADVDRNLRGLLRAMILAGHFDDGTEDLPQGVRNTPGHQALARRIAAEGIVLLKNDRNVLPLDLQNIRQLAVLGPKAKRKQGGIMRGGSSGVWPPYEITPYEGLVRKTQGRCTLRRRVEGTDAAIVFVGLGHGPGGDCEGWDRKQFELPRKQVDLILETAAHHPNTVVVLLNGSPIGMEEWIDAVPAVVEAWCPGMEGGNAIADVLFGDVNPSGKLPVTFPKRLSDSPAHRSARTFPGGKEVQYEEGIFVGYRHFDTRGIEPRFSFGHGLSYTRFEFDNLRLSHTELCEGETLHVLIDVTNAGDRAGSEVVQLYLCDEQSRVERPSQELKGFQKMFLKPGETCTAHFELDKLDLAYFDEALRRWVVEAGGFRVLLGSSSRDIRARARFEWLETYA